MRLPRQTSQSRLQPLWARFRSIGAVTAALAFLCHAAQAGSKSDLQSLEALFNDGDLIVLADTKHGVRDRVEFFSSPELFEAMAKAGVRHVAIEMPRALGRQASTIETAADIEAFAMDVLRMGIWHFTDPDHNGDDSDAVQLEVATALGRQILLAKRYGMSAIVYDFNNPLGGFRTITDPVYRCLAQLNDITWVRYGLDSKVTKDQRDAAIMRERFNHDDELASYITDEVNGRGGGKLVVISGYTHAVLPGGLASRLSTRMHRDPQVVAIFKDQAEQDAFHTFLWDQSRLISIDLSRPPQFNFSISRNVLTREAAPGRYSALDGSREPNVPAVCLQLALTK